MLYDFTCYEASISSLELVYTWCEPAMPYNFTCCEVSCSSLEWVCTRYETNNATKRGRQTERAGVKCTDRWPQCAQR